MSPASQPVADHGAAATVGLRNATRLPALGQGSWNLGQGRHPAAQEIDALRTGCGLGMTLIDTAEMYGDGRSESLIGRALAGLAQRPRLVSKVLPSNASARGIVRACEASLARLGVERLDLYLLHWRGGARLPEVVDTFEQLRDAGRIAGWGVSNFDVDDMEALWSVPGGDRCLVNQVLYHVGSRGIEFDLLPWCIDHEVAVMAYSPLGSRALLEDATLARIGERRGVSATAVALAWAIRGGHVVAIPESGSVAHVRENAAALQLRLTADDLALLDRHFPPPVRKLPLDVL
ncbi:aldo/keto reductase [Luteimonas sp. BDR2-5]|uniref:aldo/keto reductase n=1 Tax=Proluteimonas luteida TaxID=2878685 RepID=UPI001E3EF9DF|nr:aldo/keto reductase [Luteimonas sp. BDR2-5]MCD9028128.1 aldo/keto reductase [Luteimonas sp. BDR2-5]